MRSRLLVKLSGQALMLASARRQGLLTHQKIAHVALCGVVTQAFPNEFAARFKIGDRVMWFFRGDLPKHVSTEFFVYPEQVAFVPDNVADNVATDFAENSWPCMPLIDRVRTRAPHVVVLSAQSRIGLYAIRFAKIHGAFRIVALCYGNRDEKRVQSCKLAGADSVVFVNHDLVTSMEPLELQMTSLVFDATRDNRVFQFLQCRLRPGTCYVRATARRMSGPLNVRQFARSIRLAFRGSTYVEASLRSVLDGSTLESMLNETSVLALLKAQTKIQEDEEEEEEAETETETEETEEKEEAEEEEEEEEEEKKDAGAQKVREKEWEIQEEEEEASDEEAVARSIEQQLGVRLSQFQIK
jgi:NADPH:quinone reductase-like Zn-dependent oxidoreductase